MRVLFLISVMFLSACFLEPKIDASSEKAMQESIANVMKGLSAEKQDEFQSALQAIMFSNVNDLSDIMALGQNIEATTGVFMGRIDGKTANEVIAMAKKIQNDHQSGFASDEASKQTHNTNTIEDIAQKGQEKAKRQIYDDTLRVSLRDMALVERDYSKYVNVNISFKNLSGKNIRGVKGVATFKDIFGDVIKRVNLSSDEAIPANETYVYDGNIEVNQFSDSDIKLATTPKEKIQFSFEPEVILFEDDGSADSSAGVPQSAEDFLMGR